MNARLKVSLPPQLETLLDQLAAATGRTKSSLVCDAVRAAVPRWKQHLRCLEGPQDRPSTSGPAAVPSPSNKARVERLSRQQRRAQAREAAKGPRIFAPVRPDPLGGPDDLGP